MTWKNICDNAFRMVVRQYENGKMDAAIGALKDYINCAFDFLRENVSDLDEQGKAAEEVIAKSTETCRILHEESIREWDEYGKTAITPLPNAQGSRVGALIRENNRLLTGREIAISQAYASLGFNLIEMFGDTGEFGKKGVSMFEKGISTIRGLRCGGAYGAKPRERREIIVSYKKRMAFVRKITAKRHTGECGQTGQVEGAVKPVIVPEGTFSNARFHRRTRHRRKG